MASELQGPFRDRDGNTTVPRTVVNWIDNVTTGLVVTLAGAGNVLVALIGAPASRPVRISTTSENYGQQFLVENAMLGNQNYAAYSLGLFNIGADVPRHEAGHSQQTGEMGVVAPLVVGLSYAVEGHDNSFWETWADVEGYNYEKYAATYPTQVGLGTFIRNGQVLPYLVLKFSLDERIEERKQNVELQKIYEWLRVNVTVPITNAAYEKQRPLPAGLELDLLRKTVNVNAGPGVEHGNDFDLSFSTEQRYAHLELDPVQQTLSYQALHWAAQFGLTYEGPRQTGIEATAVAGGGLGLDGYHAYGSQGLFKDGDGALSLGASLNAALRLRLLRYLTIYGAIERYWLVSQYARTSLEVGVTNAYRDPKNDRVSDFWNTVELGLRYRNENWQRLLDDASLRVHRIELSGGVRF